MSDPKPGDLVMCRWKIYKHESEDLTHVCGNRRGWHV